MTTLVIAKYNEDISWLKKYEEEGYKIKVYDKSPSGDIPNIGREAETFARYIVEHYDTLSEYTVFLQGNPFDHGDICINPVANCATYVSGKGHTEPNGMYGQPVKEHYENILGKKWEFPYIVFTPGAQHTVHKNCILQHSYEFWKRLHTMLNKESDYNKYEEDVINPWTMERLWGHVFKI